jgi:hypothetical protein
MAMVIVGPAIVVSVVMMLDLMRRAMMLDNGAPVFLLSEAAVISVEVVFPPIDVPHVDFIDV